MKETFLKIEHFLKRKLIAERSERYIYNKENKSFTNACVDPDNKMAVICCVPDIVLRFAFLVIFWSDCERNC